MSSSLPRTGLFSRNHVANLTQRNRLLQQNDVKAEEQQRETQEKDISVNENVLEQEVNDSPNSSYASLPRDQEGFDDLDAYFNRANTPQKTPKPTLKSRDSSQSSHMATPSSHRKGVNVLVAKPLKMISSKIAEHYKREPRLAVSMSEVMSLEAEAEVDVEGDLDVDDDEIVEIIEIDDSVDNVDNVVDQKHFEGEDRIQRAKRELEEMSIGNSFESLEEPEPRDHVNNYAKSSLHQSTTMEMMPIDDDVLMDRLVEEMLVNDNEIETRADVIDKRVYEIETREHVQEQALDQEHALEQEQEQALDYTQEQDHTQEDHVQPHTIFHTRKKQQRKPKATLLRRPVTYYAGTADDDEGLRRSHRMKMEPLRYWANEKVCYGRAEDPSITHPVIVNVIKKPELDDPTFSMGLTRKRRRPDANVTKLKSQAFGPDCDVEAEVNCYDRPGEEEVRLLALSHHHVQGDEVKDSSFRIHTIFTEATYMSSGQLIFPPLSQKPTKNSSRHALVFYVITGSFRIEINRISFMIGPGGQFHVPRANPYTITHVSEDKNAEGRLFFCHCKDNSE